jgi:DNA modification methylase
MNIEQIPIKDLIFAEYNPRQLTTDQYEHLKASLSRFGFVDPVIANAHKTRQNIIIGGHQRVKVWKDLGHAEVPVHFLDLPLEKERELNIRLNKNSGEWDWDVLGNNFEPDELKEWGFTDEDLGGLDIDVEEPEAPEPKTNIADELQEKWKVERGQVWEIGKHRLMCGDCTEQGAVDSLLEGNKPALMVTDPPYGVAYSGGEVNASKRDSIAGDQDTAIFSAFASVAAKVMPSGAWYIWFADTKAEPVYEAIRLNGYSVRALIVWHKLKAHYGAPSAHYLQKHEPCLYSVRGSADFDGPSTEVTVWEYDQPSRNEYHPTQKPIECMKRPISNHKGDVYDPFLGSGTTMVAAEQLGRTCYGMEIEPKYCAVILERMTDMGLSPILQKQELANA